MNGPRADVRLNADLELPAPDVLRSLDEQPFNIAIFGDFSGRADRRAGDARPPDAVARLVDRDELDAVLASLTPSVRLEFPDGRPTLDIQFRQLDDFHPDSLFQRLPLFGELRGLRARLADPATFAAALAELGGPSSGQPEVSPPDDRPDRNGGVTSAPGRSGAGGLLDLVMDTTAPETIEAGTSVLTRADDLRAYVRRVVAPHLVARADPRQAEMVDHVDRAISEEIRAILHDPQFQALEALWRGIFFLTRRLETSVSLRLYLVDVGEEELRVDLLRTGGSEQTALRKLLASGPEKGARGPWSLLIGTFSFGPSDDDLALAYALSTVASAVRAPWISAADPRLAGCPSVEALTEPESWSPTSEAWEALRRMPEARWLGLALPRFLLRAPYGVDEECELFQFEEFVGESAHEHYLWGNPALACALLIGQAFEQAGWQLRPGTVREIGGLPLHLPGTDGDPAPKPCAEVPLSMKAAERLLENGVMPLASMKDSDAVLLVRFQSIAAPPRALAGSWTEAH